MPKTDLLPSPLATRPALEPATLLAGGNGRPKRNRRWERRNRGFTYRIPPELHARMHEIQAEITNDAFTTTIDLIAESLIQAGLEAYDAGHVDILGHELRASRRRAPSPAQD